MDGGGGLRAVGCLGGVGNCELTFDQGFPLVPDAVPPLYAAEDLKEADENLVLFASYLARSCASIRTS